MPNEVMVKGRKPQGFNPSGKPLLVSVSFASSVSFCFFAN
jgi:hypothetical protein